MTIKEFKSNTLVIPKGLHAYEKVEQLFKYHHHATILYKSFDDDLTNVEFYTQTYCIVFNCSGVETITSYDFKEVVIREDELLFLPKDMYLISDFIKTDKSLEAFLFFFDDDIIEKFLSIKKMKETIGVKVILALKVKSETKKEFIAFLHKNVPNVRNFEGCMSVKLYFDGTTNEMMITEDWMSKEHHGKYIDFISENGVMQDLISYLQNEPTIKYYEILDV